MSTRDDAQLDFWLPDLGRGQGHPVVAPLSRLQATAEGCAVDRRHGRLGRVLKALDDAGQARPAPLLPRCDLAELLDVRPGDEGPSASDQHDCIDAVVITELPDSCQNAVRDTGAESVHGGVDDRDDADAALDAQTD